ncbi:MAG: DNA-binding response regulator [Chloroflexi bacterium]|nr:MAG: DNA-binding response regulator [Chloroflexota bacterium]RLC95311.1 MAG: DNA-binding response regulator [Chloroflexota bacterium]
MAKTRVLVVDDDLGLQKLARVNLETRGYQVSTASDGETALSRFQEENPALVILDVMMPGMDGFEICRRIRATSDVPIIMLTAKDQEEDVLRGLECGADDYVTKPFSVDVLLARVKAVLRRTKFPEEMPQPTFRCGDLVIDFEQHRVSVAGQEVSLTATEFKLLSLLTRNAGRILTQDQLLERIWGWEYRGERHILQVAVARLRQKIGDDPHNPRYIITRVGIGYTFVKPSSA